MFLRTSRVLRRQRGQPVVLAVDVEVHRQHRPVGVRDDRAEGRGVAEVSPGGDGRAVGLARADDDGVLAGLRRAEERADHRVEGAEARDDVLDARLVAGDLDGHGEARRARPPARGPTGRSPRRARRRGSGRSRVSRSPGIDRPVASSTVEYSWSGVSSPPDCPARLGGRPLDPALGRAHGDRGEGVVGQGGERGAGPGAELRLRRVVEAAGGLDLEAAVGEAQGGGAALELVVARDRRCRAAPVRRVEPERAR